MDPQTADQINAPFLGKAEPLPPDIKSQFAPVQVAKTAKPTGWWSLDLIGTREGVLKAIASADIPARWKSLLQAEVEAIPDSFNHLELDAHYTLVESQATLQLTISPDTILT